MWPQQGVDRCMEHPGVRWIGQDTPCWMCDPGWWRENRPLAEVTEPLKDGVSLLVREMVESGHWPPSEETQQ